MRKKGGGEASCMPRAPLLGPEDGGDEGWVERSRLGGRREMGMERWWNDVLCRRKACWGCKVSMLEDGYAGGGGGSGLGGD